MVTHSGFVALPSRPVAAPLPTAAGSPAAGRPHPRVKAERPALDQRHLLTSHAKFPRARKPATLTMAVACATVLAAGAAAGAAVFWPGPASARPAGGISDETLAGAGTTAQRGTPQITAGPAGPGQAISTFKGQHSQSLVAASVAAQQAAQAAARARAARLAAQQAAAQAAQQAAASSPPPAVAAAPPVTVSAGSAQQIAMSMLGAYGWSSAQFSCLNNLWSRESGWSVTAENPSGAYGIPQALPGSKMASAGADWATSATTQIRWGLGYIRGLYGSPCGAWSHEEDTGWY